VADEIVLVYSDSTKEQNRQNRYYQSNEGEEQKLGFQAQNNTSPIQRERMIKSNRTYARYSNLSNTNGITAAAVVSIHAGSPVEWYTTTQFYTLWVTRTL
jgi:hypothetical protein